MQLVRLTTLALALTGLFACSENPVTTIDRSSDCAQICDRYQECVATNYNTAACRDRCTDMKSSADTAKVDHCQACISERSCTGSIFKCTTECVGIVP